MQSSLSYCTLDVTKHTKSLFSALKNAFFLLEGHSNFNPRCTFFTKQANLLLIYVKINLKTSYNAELHTGSVKVTPKNMQQCESLKTLNSHSPEMTLVQHNQKGLYNPILYY